MKKHILIITGFFLIGISSSSFPAAKIISCPTLSLQHYGKTSFFDRKIGKTWSLNWHLQQNPVWKNVSIPQTWLCGKSMAQNGMKVNYQCSLFLCKSNAVVAQLGLGQSIKCFNTFVSTQNSFYCEGFSVE